MAKDKGKKLQKKGMKIGQPSAKIKKVKVPKIILKKTTVPAPLTNPVEPTTSEPESNNNGAAVWGTEKQSEKAKRIYGYIFMCNPSTKLECYQYRVFGLPLAKKEMVEEIKPGAKLFLFDFQLKLLYGIYEATSAGKLNLEPAAFRGKYPAQVKFKIFKECLPLPEDYLRHIMKENYTGSKFKQELSRKQVKNLLSSFRPLTASPSLSRAMPASAIGHQFTHTGRMPATEVPYLAQMHYSHIPPFVEPQHVSKVKFLPYGYHRASAYAEHINSTFDLQSVTAASSYQVANSQRSSFTEGVAQGVQEPSYSSYRTLEERPPHDQVTSLGRRYLTEEKRASHDQVANLERRYLTVEERGPHHQVTNLERQYHHLPLQREAALYHDTVVAYNPAAPALYTNSSVAQPQEAHAPYYPLPLQRGPHYQDTVVAYNSNPAALSSQYNAVAYAPPTTMPQAGISQVNAPVSLYYSYNAANQLSR